MERLMWAGGEPLSPKELELFANLPLIESPEIPQETVSIIRDGDAVIAMLGPDLQAGIGGFGDTIPEALRDLSAAMERENW